MRMAKMDNRWLERGHIFYALICKSIALVKLGLKRQGSYIYMKNCAGGQDLR